MTGEFRFGYVTLVGRPNVGKSTLLNRLIGKKISITSPRPQTTRHRILGIRTTEDSQIVLVDTPGFHTQRDSAFNRMISRTALSSIEDMDVVILMIEAPDWRREDHAVLRAIGGKSHNLMLAINKIDRLKRKEQLLPLIEHSQQLYNFVEIIPLSAKTGHNIESLVETVRRYLPAGAAGFPADQLTDRSERFMAAEFVREQLFRQLGQELPYAMAVELLEYAERDKLILIQAQIWVDKSSHKAIVIGKDGRRLKQIGIGARRELERLLGKKIHLELWVKVRSGWSDNQAALNALGYNEDLT